MACERNHQTGGRLGKIDSPRTLPTCEGGYKPFKIGELFDVKTSKSIDKKDLKCTSNSNSMIQFIGRTSVNNGVQAYTERLSFEPNRANTFSVIQVGESVMQFRDVEWYSSQNIFILTPLDSRLITSKLYIIAATNKALQRYNGGYNDYPTLNSLKGLQITLPVTKDGNIDYQFMDMRVRELEEERVRELEAYLKAAGFEDCALNASECEALSLLSSGISTKYFKIRELFEKQSTIRLGIKVADVSKEKTNAADLPVLTAGIINQGLVGFIPRANATILKNVISVSANGANTGAMFYQPDEFTVLQDSYAIGWRDTRRNVEECVYLYLVSCLQKSVRGYYDWSNKAGWEKIKGLTISLPITTDGAIDYAFMETAIRAMEKQCIARLKASFAREHEAYMQVIF